MKRLSYILIATVIVCASPALAAAQAPPTRGIDVNTFNVAVGDSVYITQHGAHVPNHLNFGIGLLFNYHRNPFTVANVVGGSPGDQETAVVRDLLMAELYGYLGLFKYVSLGVSMPLGLYQTGTQVDNTGQPAADFSGFSWGDLGIHLKSRFYGKETGFAFGALLTITAPVGHFAEQFVGEGSATFRPRLLFEYRHKLIQAAVNLGALVRLQEARFFEDTFRIGHQMTYGIAVAVRPSQRIPLHIITEWYGRSDFTNLVERNPMEIGLGLTYRLPKGVHLLLGANAGVLAGIGTPDFRVYFGVRWAPPLTDTDKDGIVDEHDKCPKQPEDKDGFEDTDGCPDPDNDKDGFKDEIDKCPNQPEDRDGYQDDDGCPDPDNDGDGIPDKQDNCPMAKGDAKNKGCPLNMLDKDGDGVPDHKDKCPDKPEDKDGFEDDDGCPDLDNDKDGIPDETDKCKNDPEDKDGHKDDDGCPDPDDDGDGVCDDNPTIQGNLSKFRGVCIGRDKCPGKKETINGIADEDGCPDRGAGNIAFSAKPGAGYVGRFVVKGARILFKGNSTTFAGATEKVLKQVAHYLRAYPQLVAVSIVAHTDLLQNQQAATRTTLAWANAIRSYLVGQGIDGKRLQAVGKGRANPRCRRRNWRCHYLNRRVELLITEIKR